MRRLTKSSSRTWASDLNIYSGRLFSPCSTTKGSKTRGRCCLLHVAWSFAKRCTLRRSRSWRFPMRSSRVSNPEAFSLRACLASGPGPTLRASLFRATLPSRAPVFAGDPCLAACVACFVGLALGRPRGGRSDGREGSAEIAQGRRSRGRTLAGAARVGSVSTALAFGRRARTRTAGRMPSSQRDTRPRTTQRGLAVALVSRRPELLFLSAVGQSYCTSARGWNLDP